MRQNIWIKTANVEKAEKLISCKSLSEFVSEMIEKHADKWLEKKIKNLQKNA